MNTTLLLNNTFEPLRIISWKRAVMLVLSEKAEILHEGEGRVRSAHEALPIPAVIKLKYFVKVPYRAKLSLNRRTILARDNHECQFSGCAKVGSTIDHVVPRSRGGRHEWGNVVAACSADNAKKADRLLSECGMTLKRQPYTPKGTKWLIVGLKEIDEAWQPYLEGAFA